MDFRTALDTISRVNDERFLNLSIADAMALADAFANIPTPPVTDHNALVGIVLRNEEIMGLLVNNRKILAIKTLRAEAQCGLLEAKEAVEALRVTAAVEARKQPYIAPWERELTRVHEGDEPPF